MEFDKDNFQKVNGFENLFIQNTYSDIEYSDGEVENKILNVISQCSESNKVTYDELENHINDWPTQYHFAWERTNILKPFTFNKNQKILELGGGTGVLTNFIAPHVKEIISIEGTLARAKCISKRCQQYNNVKTLICNFLEADLVKIFGEHSFDVITLIGVLEYSNVYSKNNEDKTSELIKVCKRLLKKDGHLIIAIENKIGLKYLLGYEEDHVGKPFYGIQNLYKKNEVITFTREEIKDKLIASGFLSNRFLYPFPDYKLPKIIFRENFNVNEISAKLISSLLWNINSRNYSDKNNFKLHEYRIMENLIKEGILEKLSNSFLIISSLNGKENTNAILSENYIAQSFSVSRKYKYSNQIDFTSSNSNQIEIAKSWNNSMPEKGLMHLANSKTINYQYIKGSLLHILLDDKFILKEKEDFIILLNKWVDFLKDKIHNYEFKEFDLLPSNIIVNSEGEFIFFDTDEWICDFKFSVEQVLYRFFLVNKKFLDWLIEESELSFESRVNIFLKNNDLLALNDADLLMVQELEIFIRESVYQKKYLHSFLPKLENKVVTKSKFKNVLKKYLP